MISFNEWIKLTFITKYMYAKTTLTTSEKDANNIWEIVYTNTKINCYKIQGGVKVNSTWPLHTCSVSFLFKGATASTEYRAHHSPSTGKQYLSLLVINTLKRAAILFVQDFISASQCSISSKPVPISIARL